LDDAVADRADVTDRATVVLVVVDDPVDAVAALVAVVAPVSAVAAAVVAAVPGSTASTAFTASAPVINVMPTALATPAARRA
jgi:hypothetical protein